MTISRARNRPLFAVEQLPLFEDFSVRRREDGATTFRGSYVDEHGTRRTRRRFVEIVLTDRGEWRGRNGIRHFEPRAAWRSMTDANARLHAAAFARHALEHVRRRAAEQIDSLGEIAQAIANGI